MILLRRSLVLIALFFWQGGFTFYASVVVPVGQHVSGNRQQGFVTRQVTVYLNLAGAAALTVLLWDLLAGREPSNWRRMSRWVLWTSMAFALLGLFLLHRQLDESLMVKGHAIRDPDAFYAQHRLYLWISTLQWACGLLYLIITLFVWRKADRFGEEVEAARREEK